MPLGWASPDAETGTFTSKGPLGLVGGKQTHESHPSPTNAVDPLGLQTRGALPFSRRTSGGPQYFIPNHSDVLEPGEIAKFTKP